MRDDDTTPDDLEIDRLLGSAALRVVTTSPGIDAEIHRMALAHGASGRAARPGRLGRSIAAAAVLVGVALGGAAVGAAASSPSGIGERPQPQPQRTLVMSKALDGGRCDLAWTLTVRTHVTGYLRQLDDAAAYLREIDVAAIDPDPEWLEALDNPDTLAAGPARTPLEREGNAFMMAVVKSAWTDGGVSDDVVAMETTTVCTEASAR